MNWLTNYHEDHMAVLLLLSKLEGNIKDLEIGEPRPNMSFELNEFGKVLTDVIIPHFKNEEENIYPKAAKKDEAFIKEMYQEHYALSKLFEEYLTALQPLDQQTIIKSGKAMISLLKGHIEKEETILPKLLT